MRDPSFEKTKGPGVTAPGETSRQPLELTRAEMCVRHLARFKSHCPTACLSALKHMHALPFTLPEQTWNASAMTRQLEGGRTRLRPAQRAAGGIRDG